MTATVPTDPDIAQVREALQSAIGAFDNNDCIDWRCLERALAALARVEGRLDRPDSRYAEAYQRGLMDANRPLPASTSDAMAIAEAMAVALTPEGRTQMTCGEVVDIRNRFAAIIQKAIDAGQTPWQPISSAPRDGTQVLIAGGTYHYDASTFAEEIAFNSIKVSHCDNHGRWWGGYGSEYDGEYWHDPTHWQPFPPPPKPEEMG